MKIRIDRFMAWLEFNLAYFRKPPWDTGISPPELIAFIGSHPVGRALDLGCGTGTNALTLARGGWQVTGVDFAPAAIAQAVRKLKGAGLKAEFRVGDVTGLQDLHGPFDLILDIGCFHSLSPVGRSAYRRNLQRLLAPGGVFLMYAFLRPEGRKAGPGIELADLDALAAFLQLVQRQDGKDRGNRPSSWLNWQFPFA
jgi:SAM-dependent methyltransferase